MPFEILTPHNSLIQDKISRLRDERTESEEFVRLIEDLSSVLAFHAAAHIRVEDRTVSTPRRRNITVKGIPDDHRFFVFSLFRAAVPMAKKLKSLLPGCGVVHVVYENKEIVQVKELPLEPAPLLKESSILIADPISGTGSSILKIVEILEGWQVSSGRIQVICIAAASAGIERILKHHPNLQIFALVEEHHLLPDGYLDPGFGDVGNRVFGLSGQNPSGEEAHV